MNIDYSPWDLTALSHEQRELICEALDRTNFNFKALIPGLEAQVRRNTIPVLFSDLSRWQQELDAEHHHDHEASHTIIRTVDNRKRVLGLAWYSGKVEIERTCSRDLAMEVFLAEGAHMVDFFWMTPEHRQKLFTIYHGGSVEPHDHGWFEETGNDDYWSWVGESFMYGFIAAFSTVPYTGDSFDHQTTLEIGQQIRDVLAPPNVYIRRVTSSIVHRLKGWHERQIADAFQESFATREEAEARGFRLCKTCNWRGL